MSKILHSDAHGRICVKCEEYKLYSFFHKHKGCAYGHNTVCKLCRRVQERKQWEEYPLIKKMLSRCKHRAKTRGLDFNIEESDIIIPDKCPVFGTPFEHDTQRTASVDRIDPTQGYVKGNIQIISKRANALKGDATIEELECLVNYLKSIQ